MLLVHKVLHKMAFFSCCIKPNRHALIYFYTFVLTNQTADFACKNARTLFEVYFDAGYFWNVAVITSS